MWESFRIYMAEEKKIPYYIRILGLSYHNEFTEESGHTQDYWKAIKWQMKYLESGECPTGAASQLRLTLHERTDGNPNGRPEDVSLKEVAVLLHAMETITRIAYLRKLPRWLNSDVDWFLKQQKKGEEITRKYRYETMVELESIMTPEELRDAYLEMGRLENLLGDALYDEKICNREDYPWEKEKKEALEFHLREGNIKITE